MADADDTRSPRGTFRIDHDMKAKCPECSEGLEIADPTEPSPGGAMKIKCSVCGTVFAAKNPKGSTTFVTKAAVYVDPADHDMPVKADNAGGAFVLYGAGVTISMAEAMSLKLVSRAKAKKS